MARKLKESFLGRKYMSILRASVLVEAVAYIVSLTDTLVAGNMLGTAALSAVGLVAPAEVNESAAANLSETAVLLLEENGISSRPA